MYLCLKGHRTLDVKNNPYLNGGISESSLFHQLWKKRFDPSKHSSTFFNHKLFLLISFWNPSFYILIGSFLSKNEFNQSNQIQLHKLHATMRIWLCVCDLFEVDDHMFTWQWLSWFLAPRFCSESGYWLNIEYCNDCHDFLLFLVLLHWWLVNIASHTYQPSVWFFFKRVRHVRRTHLSYEWANPKILLYTERINQTSIVQLFW